MRFLADFQGGAGLKSEIRTPQQDGSFLYQYQLQNFDGMTGQPYPASGRIWKYWATLNPPAPGFA
jgi:hypothetical protein